MRSIPFEERFWQYVKKNDGPDACWEWTGAMSRGYGSLSVRGAQEGAHRVSYRLHFGPIPKGKMVLHTCDNPACVRPEHLYVGTAKDNTRDALERHRYGNWGRNPASHLHGEKHPLTKLTEQDVRSIRQGLAAHVRQRSLATRFGVSEKTICDIKMGRSWSHVK